MSEYYRLGLDIWEARERDDDATGDRIEAEVDNMTADDLQQYCEDRNTDDLWEIHRKIAVAAIDKDWASVESHTAALVKAIKDDMWSNAK